MRLILIVFCCKCWKFWPHAFIANSQNDIEEPDCFYFGSQLRNSVIYSIDADWSGHGTGASCPSNLVRIDRSPLPYASPGIFHDLQFQSVEIFLDNFDVHRRFQQYEVHINH